MVLDVVDQSPPTEDLIPEARHHQRRRYVRAGIVFTALGVLVLTGIGIGAAVLLGGPSNSAKSPSSSVVLHSRSGVVMGTAIACTGPVYEPVAHLEVYRGNTSVARAEMYKDVAPVAKKNLPTDTPYRFVLPPGRYFLSNTGNTEFPQPFVISAGRTVHLNVWNPCQ